MKNIKSDRVLKNNINNHGYAIAYLYNIDGKPKHIAVHRLVATAFIENPYNLPQVNHKDENKLNNDISNLEWVTASQNTRYSAHKVSCKINQFNIDGELVNQWESIEQIKRELGYSRGYITDCCKGRHNKAYGFRWEYAGPSQQQKQNRPVVALTKDGEFVAKYKSVAEASRGLNICRQAIWCCLNGRLKSTNGLRFIYLD